jgi:hypothetical protein
MGNPLPAAATVNIVAAAMARWLRERRHTVIVMSI